MSRKMCSIARVLGNYKVGKPKYTVSFDSYVQWLLRAVEDGQKYRKILHVDRLSVKLGVTKLLWKSVDKLEFRR